MIRKHILASITFTLLATTVFAETRLWTLKNGKTVEAELMAILGGKVTLKTLKGKTVKISENEFSQEDIYYLELATPPKLDLSLAKKSKVRVFPDSLSELPSSAYHDYKAVIKQTSSKPYRHELTAELFVIGREKIGDKHTLLDYQKETFSMTEGSKSVFQLPSRTVELMSFAMNGQNMGEEYAGYMIIVTDIRGEVIAYECSRDQWYLIADKLRTLPVGKYFDKEGERCFTTPAKRWY